MRESDRAPLEPSAAYLEVARAARAAFRGEGAREDVPYRAPAIEGRASDIDEAMSAYIGRNWRGYRGLWQSMREAPGLRLSFSSAAASMGGVWLLYRKRYAYGAAVLAAEAALASWNVGYSSIAELVIAGFLGLFGKSIVLAAGATELDGARRRYGSPEQWIAQLRAAGGVNPWVAALGLAGIAWFTLLGVEGALDGASAGAGAGDAAETLRTVLNALP